MSWYNKEYATRFDQSLIEGLFFLDGRIIEQLSGAYVWGMKAPMVTFPSGEAYPIWDEINPLIEVIPTIDVPLFSTRDEAYDYLHGLVTVGVSNLTRIEKWADDRLYLYATPTDDGCLVTYNNVERKIINVMTGAFQERALLPVLR